MGDWRKKMAATIIEKIAKLNPRESLDKKEYKSFYNDIKQLHTIVYDMYRNREQGKATDESESKAMTEITKILHTIGKCNGRYISVVESDNINGQSSTLLNNLIYHSYNDKIICTSKSLAELLNTKSELGKAKAKAHKDLIDGKGSAKAYKESVTKYDEILEKIATEQKKANAEKSIMCKASDSTFAKFVINRLKAIAEKRMALTEDEAKALRKLRNKAKRDQKKSEKAQATPTPTQA